MKATFLSKFTPSMMSHEALEAIFVQRESLAKRLVELIRDSALTSAKHHTLLIGARGMGKTHLVSLIYHRIRASKKIRQKLLIAWLREEEWGVTSFLDLLLRIFRALLSEHPDATLSRRVEELYQMQPKAATRAAAALLKEFVGSKTLLILVENLDELFQGLKEDGQKQLRSYLQENPFCTILATSQNLFNGISRQTSPFYGFFRLHHLEELTQDEAAELLTKIAEFENDQELVAFINSTTGRARLRAVQHLAGGNHRVHVIFSQFLTRESLDELVEPLMRTLDDLTPYYQARIQWLSLQQRKIVEFLCDRRGAVMVKEIAQRCFLTHQITSSQLKTLREMGYVQSTSIGRESFYELREPLMRLSSEVKKHRAEPIRLLIDFLRIWYSRTEMEQRLEFLPAEVKLERAYLQHAITITDEGAEDPKVAACLKDYRKYLSAKQHDEALKAAEELTAVRGTAVDWFIHANCLARLDRYEEAQISYGKVNGEALAGLQYNFEVDKGWNQLVLRLYEDALVSFDKAIKAKPDDAQGWQGRSIALRQVGRHREELMALNRFLELSPGDSNDWQRRGTLLQQGGQLEEALASYKKMAQRSSDKRSALRLQSLTLHLLGRNQEAIRILGKLLRGELESQWKTKLLYFRVGLLLESGQWNKARHSVSQMDEEEVRDLKLSTGLSFVQILLSAGLTFIVTNIFLNFHKVRDWKLRLKKLFESSKKNQAIPELNAGMVVGLFTIEKTAKEKLRLLLEAWREIVSDDPEFQFFLRLADVFVRYKETGDERILLELPVEERKVLESMIEVFDKTQIQTAL